MATMVVDLELGGDKTVFYGSSEEDMVYAKTFWQSVHLLPPMESRLVSSDIKQRLKVAPTGTQPVNTTYKSIDESQKLQEFLQQAKMQERMEEWQHFEKLSDLRQKDIALLEKHRHQRIEKEKISAPHRPTRHMAEQFILPQESDDDMDEDPAMSLQELDQFDRRMGQLDDCDSD